MPPQPPASSQPTPRTPPSVIAIIVLVIGIICLIILSGLGGFLLYAKYGVSDIRSTSVIEETPSVNAVPEVTPQPPALLTNTPNNTPSEDITPPTQALDGVEWESPEEIASLNLFEKQEGWSREDGAKYYKVGTFTDGPYKNADFILVSAPYGGPAFYPAFYRFAKNGTTLTFFTKHSDDLYDGDDVIRSRFSIDETMTFSSLIFPDTIQGPSSRQVLEADPGVNVFFSLNDLKKSFEDETLGIIYTSDTPSSVFTDIFNRNGFYLKAPDGTARVYELKIDFVGKDQVPSINWNDGSANTEIYYSSDTGGCGSQNYISVAPSYLNRTKDLTAAGITNGGLNSKGDTIYVLKDQNHSILKDFYENEYQIFEGTKVSYPEFVASRPLFYWIDPFDRLIKFESNRFIPPAECGKPVIYLYPEQTTDVSVKVEPKGGLTYSEPLYQNGWIVNAKPNGQLTERSSGKTYPYLFWEGRGSIYQQPTKGFVTSRENVRMFLVEKLTALGLNSQEQYDFLEFWEPKMQSAPYYFVSFLGKREMDQLAPLTIEPKPDTVIRILMDFKPLDAPIDVEGYAIIAPERNGFTVVEWGGVLR